MSFTYVNKTLGTVKGTFTKISSIKQLILEFRAKYDKGFNSHY